MITINDINIETTVNNESYEFDVSLSYSGTRSSVYGKMFQYYMKTSGATTIDIVDQNLLTSTSYNNLKNSIDGFFRFIFIQGESYDDSLGVYSVGDVIYNVDDSSFKKCISEIATPKPYDDSDWEDLSPEDSDINSIFKSVKDILMIERSKLTLLGLRELAISEFLDGSCTTCDNSKNTKLRRTESLLQAASDNFNELNNKVLAQKYIEYIDIIN